MKRILLFISILLCITGVHAQTVRIDEVLQRVEAGNPELKALAFRTEAQKQANKADNNLPDPTASYSHMWGEKDAHETIGELTVSQQFDFPTLYAARSSANRLKAVALDGEATLRRQEILLQAKELCLDLLMLQQQHALLTERLVQAEELGKVYRKRLETGDANILESNKVNLELLNARTEMQANRTALNKACLTLAALMGNDDTENRGVTPNETPAIVINDEPLPPLPSDAVTLLDELLSSNPALLSLTAASDAARKQVAVDRQGWLPKLELGYRRNTETKLGFSGLVAGISFPLFSNRHKVQTSRAQLAGVTYEKQNAEAQARSELVGLYAEAQSLSASIREYQAALGDSHNLELLRQALDGGEINITEYFVEVSVVYQSQQNLLELENRYGKVMAQLYKSRL
ncbi:MAG: TolC family protein [Mediterranea sp.]|jgi:outer membrane protein TolC|nr:TolC family protein [Mediterranea sp.]